MDIRQLETFVAVAREGSITRAAERVHLSQPAVSAHIKAIEDALGLTIFERTSRGMSLTGDGERLLAKAEKILAAQEELMSEATRIKGGLGGKLRLGAAANTSHEAIGVLLTTLSERYPQLDVTLRHGPSADIVAGIRDGSLDVGVYNEPDEPDGDLETLEVSQFRIHVAAPPGLVAVGEPLDWSALAEVPWIYPTSSACCGRTAERLFLTHGIRPRRIVGVDREDLTRTLIAAGIGVGLLHAATAQQARARGQVELLFESPTPVRVLLAHLARRAGDPLWVATSAIMRAAAPR